MNPKRQMLNFLKHKIDQKSAHNDKESQSVQAIMDGMSAGTARLVIENQIGDKIPGDYAIASLENKGRYYVGKIILGDGTIAARLIVDKQTGVTRFI
jgi:hypothetical protein